MAQRDVGIWVVIPCNAQFSENGQAYVKILMQDS